VTEAEPLEFPKQLTLVNVEEIEMLLAVVIVHDWVVIQPFASVTVTV
jgi:hypothetical protein